jgi:hypothetical protein
MTPDQARRAAMKLRQRFEMPRLSQSPHQHVVSTAMHALADALVEIAVEDSQTDNQK